MSKVKLVIKTNNFVQLRNSPEVVSVLEAKAESIASAAGEGFETRPAERHYGRKGRARVAVVTASWRAMWRQGREHVLERAIGGGG